jgi:hypothetical protein
VAVVVCEDSGVLDVEVVAVAVSEAVSEAVGELVGNVVGLQVGVGGLPYANNDALAAINIIPSVLNAGWPVYAPVVKVLMTAPVDALRTTNDGSYIPLTRWATTVPEASVPAMENASSERYTSE